MAPSTSNSNEAERSRTYLPEDDEPGSFDIICERGVTGAAHPGNKAFTLEILDWRPTYNGIFSDFDNDQARLHKQKAKIVTRLIKFFKRGRGDEPRGRFISRDKGSKRWFECEHIKEKFRVAQALREDYTPQWVYEQKSNDLRRDYEACGTEADKARIVSFLYMYLRGGRMDKGGFLTWTSVRTRNAKGAKRQYRTDTTEINISDKEAMAWIRKDLDDPSQFGPNEGIKYVIGSGNRVQAKSSKKKKKDKGEIKAVSPSVISQSFKDMSLSEGNDRNSIKKRKVRSKKRMKGTPHSQDAVKRSTSKEDLKKKGHTKGPLLTRMVDKESKAAASFDSGRTLERREERLVNGSSTANIAYLQSVFASWQAVPVAVITCTDGYCVDKPAGRWNGRHPASGGVDDLTSTGQLSLEDWLMSNESLVTDNHSTGRNAVNRKRERGQLYACSANSLRSDSSLDEGISYSRGGSLGSLYGLRSLGSFGISRQERRGGNLIVDDEMKRTLVSSPSSLRGSLSRNLQHKASMASLLGAVGPLEGTLPLHDGEMSLNDTESRATKSLPDPYCVLYSGGSVGSFALSSNPSSSLCTTVSPSGVFSVATH